MSDIVTIPAQVLRSPAKEVTVVDKKILAIIDRMYRAIKSAKNPAGVGLAAPQIGEGYRMFFIWPDHKQEPQLFINPEILQYSQRQQSPLDPKVPKKDQAVYEGCLSVPHHYAPLSRAMSVTIKYQTIDNIQYSKFNIQLNTEHWILNTKTAVFTGFPAHIIQHEVDHLNGILFLDRALQQNTKLYKVEGKTWTEISL